MTETDDNDVEISYYVKYKIEKKILLELLNKLIEAAKKVIDGSHYLLHLGI